MGVSEEITAGEKITSTHHMFYYTDLTIFLQFSNQSKCLYNIATNIMQTPTLKMLKSWANIAWVTEQYRRTCCAWVLVDIHF